jgi:hypothetical protein
MTPVVKVDRGNYDEIQRKAFEQYLLDLAKGWAAEHERLSLEREGREPSILIHDIKLVGDYPHTVFQFQIYDRPRGLEQIRTHLLYESPTFFDEDLNLRCQPEQIVSDTLMLVRGG